jgi:hypothetical protein
MHVEQGDERLERVHRVPDGPDGQAATCFTARFIPTESFPG